MARIARASLVCVGALLSVGCADASAHDFWIEPSSYRPSVGERVLIGLRIGHPSEAEPYARNPSHIRAFFIRSPRGRFPVRGSSGHDPAGNVRIEEAGVHILAYWSQPNAHEMAPGPFESYLEEEGLQGALQERARRGEDNVPGREHFVRCAKSLLLAADGGSPGGHDEVLGLPLEIVPVTNPFTARPGKPYVARLLYEGKPLTGCQLSATSVEEPRSVQTRHTDERGFVSIDATRSGAWILDAVHIVRAVDESSVEWQSFWASLTFEIPPAAGDEAQP